MNKQQDSDTETVHTDIMNKHLTVLMRDYEREVAKWTFVYGMMSKQQQTEFQEWKTEQATAAMRQILSQMPIKRGVVILSTDMDQQLLRLTKDYDRKVAQWTYVHGILSEQQRKAFQEWKTKRMNMEINEIMSDDSSEEDENEEGTEDDESDMSCSS